MDLQADIKWITAKLQEVNDPDLIEVFKPLLKFGEKVAPLSERTSIEQYNKELDESIAQIEKGEYRSHEEVGEQIKKWAKG